MHECTGEGKEQAAQTLCADVSAHVRVCHKSGGFGADITTNGEMGGTAPGVSVSGACHNADPQAVPGARAGTTSHAELALPRPWPWASRLAARLSLRVSTACLLPAPSGCCTASPSSQT